MEIIFSHERLQVHIVDLAAALAAPEGTYTSATDWKNLAESGVLNPELMQKVSLLADMFFWIGWNARGAAEEAEQLKRIAN